MRSVLTGLAVCALALAYGSQPSSSSWPVELFTIRGHVIDAVTKLPLLAVNVDAVRVLDPAGSSGGFTHTDAQGAYVLPNRPAGPITIEAFVSGYEAVLEKITLASDVTRDFALTVVDGTPNANRSAATERDGAHRMTSLLVEGFTLRLSVPGFVGQR